MYLQNPYTSFSFASLHLNDDADISIGTATDMRRTSMSAGDSTYRNGITTPISDGSLTACGPVLRLSAFIDTLCHAPGESPATRHNAARTEPPGDMSTPKPSSFSPSMISTGSGISPDPEASRTSAQPNASCPKSWTTRPALFVQTDSGIPDETATGAAEYAPPAAAPTARAAVTKTVPKCVLIFIFDCMYLSLSGSSCISIPEVF